jgi:uncharacterized membrane protein
MAKGEKPTKEDYKNWQNDPDNWKWGIFYFNKEDKRLFPPPRNKLFAWTVNFANPISILAFIALIILMIIILPK